MGDNWKTWCRREGWLVKGSIVRVALARQRFQLVRISDGAAQYDLTSPIAKARRTLSIADPALAVWKRNRSAQLVGFRIDDNGDLSATAWVLKAGLGRAELIASLHLIASEADRWEFALNGSEDHI